MNKYYTSIIKYVLIKSKKNNKRIDLDLYKLLILLV